MKLSLFDLHCDTAGKMLYDRQPFSDNSFEVSLESAKKFENYIQVMAHFTPYHMDDEAGWSNALAMLENLKADDAVTSGRAVIQTDFDHRSESASLLLSIEDARILAEKIDRVNILYQLGIRIFTPLWKGVTCIGGSHDTEAGLTAFGKAALLRAVSLGIILDISHASQASADDIFAISKEVDRPVIASHSNAYEICSVSRNLHPEQIKRILSSHGIIGLNLNQGFLTTEKEVASAKDVFPHIDYFLAHDATDALCLGCDMDGCLLPPDLPSVGALCDLAELMLQHGYSEELIHKIFYQNAFDFANHYLKK